MRLRELFENIYETVPEGGEEHDGSLKTIGVCYGRWNPPHKGHKNVWQHAAQNPIWFVGTNEDTGGSDIKNPLPYDVKLQVMAAVMPEVAGHVIPVRDLFVMCNDIYEKYGANVHLKIYTDEQWLYTGLVKNNGVQNPRHGFYKFQQIDNVPMKRLASATDLRANALSGNKKAFYKDMGVSPSTTIEIEGQEYPIFEVVAHYLNAHQKISETKPTGKIHSRALDGGQGYMLHRDIGGYDRIYHLNRIMMAAGMADGKSKKPVDMDPDSWVEKYNVVFPYTDLEHAMMMQAFATVPTDIGFEEKRGKSEEPKDTNKTSPVAKPKRNKYGI